jgi:hypothetical protein
VRKALATFGTGPAGELLRLALPNFSLYGARHGYEIVIGGGDAHGRAPSWGKVPLLKRLLTSYDFVLWIDADALILDASVDLETVVPADAFQAFANTTLLASRGICPCCGVWAFRAGPRAQAFLTKVWAQHDLIDHKYWEQAAVMRLIGWRLEEPMSKDRQSEWDDGTFFLDEEWDMIPQYAFGYAPGKIRHYTGLPSYRRRSFDMGTDLARAHGAHLRYWVGLLERRYRPVDWPITGEIRYRTAQARAGIRRTKD